MEPERTTLNLSMSKSRSGDRKVAIKTLSQKQAIIQYLTENVVGKTSDFSKLLCVQDSRVKKIIYELIEEDIVVSEEANRNKVYRLKK